MTTSEYQNQLALKMITSFTNDLYEKTGMKASIKIDRLYIPKENSLKNIKEILSLDVLEQRFLEAVPFQLGINPLKTKSRRNEYVDLRCVFCYIACKTLNFTLISVARYLKKDHTSIIHMCKRAEKLFLTDDKFKTMYGTIFQNLNKEEAC